MLMPVLLVIFSFLDWSPGCIFHTHRSTHTSPLFASMLPDWNQGFHVILASALINPWPAIISTFTVSLSLVAPPRGWS
jgi:hypothetical protein